MNRSISIFAKFLAVAAVPTGFGVSEYATAAEWSVVSESSAVTMYATKQGMWIAGVFGEFSASVDFEPGNPSGGKIVGIVKTASVETQDAQNDAYVHGYLDVDEYPESRFESNSIEATAEGFRADGDLSLVGQRNPAALAFTFTAGSESSNGVEHAKLSGTMIINRFDFDIASEIDVNTAGQDVIVQVELDLVQESE